MVVRRRFFLCPFLRRGIEQRGDDSPGDWYEPNERMDLSLPRAVVGGVEKAIQPITHSDQCDDEGWDNIKQVCRYAIHHATFMHTWSNSKQYDDGGELLYSGLALRHGRQGVFRPESSRSIAQPPDLATDQLWFAWLLSNSAYGFILKNEDHDIHPRLIKLLRDRKQEFADLGVDVKKIQSRVNI